jgi:hypothetical protein
LPGLSGCPSDFNRKVGSLSRSLRPGGCPSDFNRKGYSLSRSLRPGGCPSDFNRKVGSLSGGVCQAVPDLIITSHSSCCTLQFPLHSYSGEVLTVAGCSGFHGILQRWGTCPPVLLFLPIVRVQAFACKALRASVTTFRHYAVIIRISPFSRLCSIQCRYSKKEPHLSGRNILSNKCGLHYPL